MPISNRICTRCKRLKTFTNANTWCADYHREHHQLNKTRRNERMAVYRAENRDVVLARKKKYRLQNKDKTTDATVAWNRTKRYGVTPQQYSEMVLQQQNKCLICQLEETRRRRNGRVSPLSIDHCHATGNVRGLLCNGCNTGLGAFRDNPYALVRAALYLQGSL